ncbi:cytochrome Caa3 oxidase [Paenibacillus sp. 598K]|nr:cytochrome Caa3 oxidase [Paenibacillus sp. 598K]
MVSKRFRVLIIAACIGMLIVLLAGALVTNTDSGRGCGDDWPLCHGKFIPAYTLESMLEYSHRVVSAIVGFLVLAVFIITLTKHRREGEPVFYASSALFFTILQALLGAAAVKWPQSPPVMALHFGFSLLAFASTMLLVIWAYRMKRGSAVAYHRAELPRSLYKLTWAIFGYIYIVVYIGAYIRHTKSAGGCSGWPLCNGELIPEMSGAAGLVFVHRVAALIIFLLIAVLAYRIYREPAAHAGLKRTAAWTFGLVLTQVLSGALVTATLGYDQVYIFTSLLHNVIISILFALLAELAIRTWKLRRR